METISPIPIPMARINIPDAPSEAAPENQPEGFAQVLARQKRPGPANESPVDKECEGTGPIESPASEEGANRESSGPAESPELAALVATLIPNAALPSPAIQPWEPPTEIAGGPLSLKSNAPQPNPALSPMETSQFDFSFQPGRQDPPILKTDPGAGPSESDRPEMPAEAKKPSLPLGILLPAAEDFRISSHKTEPAFSRTFIPPEGVSPEAPMALKGHEDVILHPVPESLGLQEKASPEIKLGSLQGKAEGLPSFPAPGPAIPGISPVVEDLALASAVLVQEQPLQGQNTPQGASEKLPGSQTPAEAPPREEKASSARIPEVPPISEKDPAASNLKAAPVSVTSVSPGTAKEILSPAETFLRPRPEGLPNPEQPSPAITRPEPGASFLERAPLERVEPGSALRDPRENPTGTGEPEKITPVRFLGDTLPGVLAEFSPPRVEGGAAGRAVEGPRPGSPEWTEEARSVYHQFSRGLRQTLQQGGERIQMAFEPPRLGSILMEINRDRSTITAHLWTDNPLTKELLEFSRGQLQKTLELDGFKLDRFEVQVRPDLKSFQEERWFGGRQPSWENNREGGRREAAWGVILSVPEAVPRRFTQGNQYVDTWV